DMVEENGASDDELEGLASLPRQIEGVWIGVTLKQMKDRTGYKFSLRTTEEADASAICCKLGGGGHARAAGCSVSGDWETARQAILNAIAETMDWMVD
ncbi:MAG: bifunctional oligoribonuclease/PAP phosphatase NrnA, partial [Oscillospiraceae bacterium]|nr:bifunctional oligoribonuclease/PAP phosphatase NrnA [Oscillospiraceae bacterium]